MRSRPALAFCAALLGAAGCRQARPAGVQPAHAQADWTLLGATYPWLDASRLVHSPGDTTLVYFRTNIALRFKPGVTDSAKRVLFARNSISVIGIGGGQFFVTIPDPGPNLDSLYAAVDRLRAQPEILLAILIPFTPMPEWPSLVDRLPPLDATRLVATTDSSLVFFRTDVTLRFRAGVPDSAKAAFFARNGLQVLGVTPSGRFFVRMPDPGPVLQNFYDALDRLEAEAEVGLVAPIPFKPFPEIH